MGKEIDPKEARKKIAFWVLVNIIFLFISVYMVWQVFILVQRINSNGQGASNKPVENQEQVENYEGMLRRQLDGVYVEEGEENIFPVSFMIDNHVDARKSHGLSKANLVYEAEVEGGITRFLAVYASGDEIDQIGPVRSARPYFVDWARELSSVYGHCGGSPEALVKIIKDGIIDLNEFYNADFFWRGKDKVAPHNIYTSSEKIDSFLNKKKLEDGNYLAWQFKEDEGLENRPEVAEIKIDFAGDAFRVGWVYKKEDNNYIRHMGGKVHKDQDGSEIRAKNIAIQYVDAEEIDSELRLRMDNVGDGKAFVCFDGFCEEAMWEKKSSAARTRFYYKKDSGDKEEVLFNAGVTWVEVVRPEREVSFN